MPRRTAAFPINTAEGLTTKHTNPTKRNTEIKTINYLLSTIILAALVAATGCARFKSEVTERVGPDGKTVERVTVVKAGTLFDSKSELAKLSSGQTDKSQKVSIGALSQESSGSNVVGFAESVVGAAVRAAVKP